MERLLNYENGLPVSVEALTVRFFPAHYHNDIQIIYVLKGEVDLRLTYSSYNLQPGDMHFVHTNDIHALESRTEDNLILLFNFDVGAFSTLYPDFHMQIFITRIGQDFVTYEKKLKLINHIFNVIREMKDKDLGYEERIFDTSTEMLRILYKDFRGFYIDSEQKIFKHTVSSDPVQIDRISRVVNFIYENYPYKISLKEIAESEHISKFYLSHLFQKYVGSNFRDFVSMVRVEMSEHQLLNSDMSITRIAQECGFSHPRFYIEHFINWFGYNPGEYRAKFQRQTIEYIDPEVKEIPLSELLEYKDVMPPVFGNEVDNGNSVFKSIDLSGKLPVKAVSWQNLLEINVDSFVFSDNFIKVLYLDFYEIIMKKGVKAFISGERKPKEKINYIKSKPQEYAVRKIRNISDDLKFGKHIKWKTEFIDFYDEKNGLVTDLGLKKPVYYLFIFLSEMYGSVLRAEDHYIISREGENLKMILFNDNHEKMYHLDVIPNDLSGAYKLTELRLALDMCFLERWKQLDHKEYLTQEEIEIINGNSYPKGQFETIPDIRQYVYHCDINPLEIVQLTLTSN